MSQHSSDRFSISEAQNPANGEFELLLRRLDVHDPLITKDNFTLTKHETTLLFDHLLGLPDFEQRALEKFQALNLARPNHSP